MYDTTTRVIPEGLQPVARSRDFTETDTPEHFRTHHLSVRWAEVVIEEGSIEFREPANQFHDEELSVFLNKGDRFVILPNIDHDAQPGKDTLFHVEFYGDPDMPDMIPLTKK